MVVKTDSWLYFFSGRVQGVGFRYNTARLAVAYRVAGYVKNLDDGRVELLVEGQKEEIDKFIQAIQARFAGHIGAIEQHETKALHLKSFEILT